MPRSVQLGWHGVPMAGVRGSIGLCEKYDTAEMSTAVQFHVGN